MNEEGRLENVNTPADNRHYYDIDWRHAISLQIISDNEITLWLSDKYIFDQVCYLEAINDSDINDIITDSLMSDSKEFEPIFGFTLKANAV